MARVVNLYPTMITKKRDCPATAGTNDNCLRTQPELHCVDAEARCRGLLEAVPEAQLAQIE